MWSTMWWSVASSLSFWSPYTPAPKLTILSSCLLTSSASSLSTTSLRSALW
ncbi:hypothetical protein PR003_g18230 [Phytophthora rubi]|uniref:REJ domain-containing protein n=1 Tax=Phytophthora rubi TaxID=129364 RepID=A0A6A3N0N0_9STRA|nr:hypothetical protein PR001_g17089 [Phytophthora rubi]KAE9033803.1 hypothetical protein PR002_g8479 [Phytophthora rubi]KAE9318428.1 hypothetical protein PR003_g18230 [Phytophthora rubi]